MLGFRSFGSLAELVINGRTGIHAAPQGLACVKFWPAGMAAGGVAVASPVVGPHATALVSTGTTGCLGCSTGVVNRSSLEGRLLLPSDLLAVTCKKGGWRGQLSPGRVVFLPRETCHDGCC